MFVIFCHNHLRVSPGGDGSSYEQMIQIEMFIPHYSRRFVANGGVRATSARSETRVTYEADDGSRSEVRGFRNFEPRTSNFVAPVSLESGIHACRKRLMNHAG